jgi:hypothetical protein
MKKLLPFATHVSMACALLLGVGAFVGGASVVFPILARAETATTFILGLVAFCTAVELLAGGIYLLMLSALVMVLRGRAFVSFSPVEECSSPSAWLGSSWDFFGAGGQQKGLRVLGFEIAVKGGL